MPIAEFFEWMILERLEPFGDRRGDVQAGVVASTIANVNRGEHQPPYKVDDLIPDWDELAKGPREQSPEAQLQFMLALQAAQNAVAKARGEI